MKLVTNVFILISGAPLLLGSLSGWLVLTFGAVPFEQTRTGLQFPEGVILMQRSYGGYSG